MPFNKPSQRKVGATLLLFVFVFWISFAALFGAARPARAQYVDPVTSIQTTLSNIWSKLSDAMVEGVSVALANAANYFLSQLAYQIAVGIVSGCPGQKPCTVTSFLGDAVANAGKGALGEAIGSLSQAGGFEELGINLCAPPSANFGLSIQLGLLDEAKPPAPKCDFNQVMANWETAAKSLSPDELKKNLWQGFKPGSQPLSMTLHATSTIKQDILYEKDVKLSEQLAKMSGAGGFQDVTDPVTKAVRTPAAAVKAEFERGEREKYEYPKIFQQIQNAGQTARGSVWGAILMNAAQTFGQTLIAQAWNKLVNKLFASQESPEAEPPIELIVSEEGISTVGAAEQAVSLAPKYAAPPLMEVGVIDPLAQFSICPAGSRGPWNCVADTQLAAGVRLGNTSGITVKEAIDKGYLHKDWELIPAEDKAKSSSEQCFSSAYCEVNLKKLRAARILPIGWEIAAHLSDKSRPYKLQDAIDNFENPSHDLYHLVDPGWVLKQPLTQCRAQVPGQFLTSPEIPRRTEVCVDAPTCLREDDFGNCIGGYGYCTRERNVWRFNGDSCPEQFNTCRTLTPRVGGSKVNYITNTIDRGVCNASNAGCQAYATKLNAFTCSLPSATCSDPNGCECTDTSTCDVTSGNRTCINSRNEICTLPQSSCASATCACSISYTCRVPEGSRTCSTVSGAELDKSDDWLQTPTKYFNKEAATCAVDKNGCSALLKLDNTESLNLVRNGGFEDVEDGDGDGEPDHAKFWSPFGVVSPTGPGATVRDTALVVNGSASLRVGPSGTATQTSCTNNACVSETGCACVSGSSKCKVFKGSGTCTITNRVVQDRIQVSANKTYTLSAVFKKAAAGSASGKLSLRFVRGDGSAYFSLASNNISALAASSAYTCTRSAGGNLELSAGNTSYDSVTGLSVVSCSFMVTVPISSAMLEITGSNSLVDDVMLEEGVGTAFHEGYGAASNQVYAKISPKYLGCGGEDTDREECSAFAAVCREGEVGCDQYRPASGEPAIPAVTGPRDSCPAACVGYDVFKQAATDFERQEKFPIYFIPSTAQSCTEQDAGCSEFTDIITEEVAYYSRIRLCQLPDAGDNQVFYSWEGSDTAGYQLKVWNLKRTEVNIADSSLEADPYRRSDLSVNGPGATTLTAPCTKLDTTQPLNTYGTPKCVDNPVDREGLCSRAAIDAGDFDCREFYDEYGNRHYRLLSKTILGTAECRRYRVTVSAQQDCTDSNGTWDNAKKECTYLASLIDSTACSAQANGCRAYKGNAATSVRALFTDDFEDTKGDWDIRLTDYGQPSTSTLSPESVTVGGHSLKFSSNAFRDVSRHVAPDNAYSISFWARGAGKLAIKFVDYTGGTLTCSVTDCSGSNCQTCVHSTGLACQNSNTSQTSGSWSCSIANRSSMVPGHDPYVPFSDAEGGNKCSNNLATSCLTDANCTGGGRCVRIQTVELSSEWKQYAVGPVIVSDPYFGRAPVGIEIVRTAGTSDVFIDKFVLKEAKDNIYVIRDSWNTPAVCDQTADGQSSPLEMLGCREYRNTADQAVNLRSFSKLCREKSVGCAAYSALQDTPRNPYEESYNAVCKLTSVCAPTDGRANCACNYNLQHAAATSTASSPVVFDVCRVAIGQTECRFHLDGQDNFANRSTHRDIVSIPADERLYLVVDRAHSCTSADAGCKTFGLANVVYEGTCTLPGASSCSSAYATWVGARQICTCTDVKTGTQCDIPAGESSCKFSPEKGMIDVWKATAFKDDPSKYEQTLCLEEEVGCEQYTAADGSWYFKDPGNKTCTYKENVTVEGRQRSGWFRKTDVGVFACYPELVKEGNYFEMYRNRDQSCSLATKCTNPAGCPCPDSVGRVCQVAEGNTQCGFAGWVGQCETKYDFCEEFVDPLATSPSNPAGQPYYYIVNSRLDKSGCSGTVNLKQGCVLFKQTSNPANTYSAGATYSKAIKEVGSTGGSVGPVNCDLTNRNTNYCNKRCFVYQNGYCHKPCTSDGQCGAGGTCRPSGSCTNYADEGKECFQDGTGVDGCATGGSCLGVKSYSNGCTVDADCSSTRHEKCVGESPSTARTFTKNDSNIILKVRQDRECGEWLTCSQESTTWDDNAKKWRSTCTDFSACSRSSKVGQALECVKFVEPVKQILTTGNYQQRDTTWAGLDYSGYSLFGKYPIQYVQPLKQSDAALGVCVSTGTDEDSKSCKLDGSDGKCVGGKCTANPFAAQRFGILNNDLATADKKCVAGTNRGSTCSNHNQCPGATKACIGLCRTNNDCASDVSLGGLGKGTCYEGSCYYALTGGSVDVGNLENAPACRAYPEEDAPFGPSVLIGGATGGYDSNSYIARDFAPDYKGANVCMKGQYCECSYQRINYGRNQGVRYVSISPSDSSTTIPAGICSGGDNDTRPCDTSDDCKPGGDTDPERNGRCVFKTNIVTARGWPGFCVDRDPSMVVASDLRQQGCNLWLPVDQLSGMPSRFNQYVDAGWPLPGAVTKLNYCTIADGNKIVTGSGAAGYVDQVNASDDNPSKAFEGTDGCCISDNDDYGLVNLPFKNIGSYQSSSNWFTPSGWSRGDARKHRVEQIVVGTNGDNDMSNHDHCETGSCKFVLNRANGWKVYRNWDSMPAAGYTYTTSGSDASAVFCRTLLDMYNSDDDGTGGTNESWGDYFEDDKSWWIGDNAPDGYDCLGAKVIWSDSTENAYPISVRFAMANGDTGIDDVYYDADVTFYFRESCMEVANVYDGTVSSSQVMPAVETDKLYAASKGGTVNGFPWYTYWDHVSTRSGLPSSGNMTPLGRMTPDTTNVTTYANGSSTAMPIPIYESEGGPEIAPGTAVAILPVACNGGRCAIASVGTTRTAGLTTVKTLFARSWGLWTFDWSSRRYNASTDKWDLRADRSTGKVPKVVTVNSDECYDDGGNLLCKEGSAGLTVNDITTSDVRSDQEAGRLKVSIKYYAYADKDHMPIIRKTVDFGDGSMIDTSFGYFKNHRGGTAGEGNKLVPICGSADTWGLTPATCEPRYFEEVKTYTCNLQKYASLPSCEPLGSATERYPCQEGGACVFRPRVQITDNWGVCNGSCPGGLGGSICINDDIYLPSWTGSDGDECVTEFESVTGGKSPWTWFAQRIFVYPSNN